MRATVVLPIRNDGALLLPLLESLVACTPGELYDVVIVDRSSTDSTAALLEQLGGDVQIVQIAADATLAHALDAGVRAVSSDMVVVSSPTSRFAEGWLQALLSAVSHNTVVVPRTPLDDVIDVIAFVPSTYDEAGPFSGWRPVDAFIARLHERGGAVIEPAPAQVAAPAPQSAPAQAPQPQPQISLPADLLGNGVGSALAEVLVAGLQGAKVGDLPMEAVERLRERLWQEEERRMLLEARDGRDVCWTDEGEAEPLVTVRIATYNRPDELMEIALPSALNQTYENLDILVVGDHTDDKTIKAMQSVKDPRVRFFDLPSPSQYPRERWGWWLASGSPPMNLGIELAKGSWINPADDDDEMTPDHVEVMLAEARRRRLEFVWSQTLMETPDGWQILGAEPLGPGATTAGAIMWSSGLRFMRMSTTCWKINEPHDGNMWRRMHEIGVRMGFLPKITYKYYMGTNMREQLVG